ncbi:hypothetical protein BCV70DRAFT_199223 [Testicularia cyperi]|uniref:Uncharacterized protein n=1 Tax=Testicularia cyperi TaxID=1882483 RepID=A0A317XSI4_9BASI|nr:hypothetical protein BCV70DRAFT_199223 [Testicularia cyperi]
MKIPTQSTTVVLSWTGLITIRNELGVWATNPSLCMGAWRAVQPVTLSWAHANEARATYCTVLSRSFWAPNGSMLAHSRSE